MKLIYLGTFYPTEIHTAGEPYETSEDVLLSDRDKEDYYPMDEVVLSNSIWVNGFDEFDAVYQESYSIVLFKYINNDTYKAWRAV